MAPKMLYDLNGNMLEKLVTPYDNGIAGEQTAKLTNVYDLLNQLTMSTTDDGKTVCNIYKTRGRF